MHDPSGVLRHLCSWAFPFFYDIRGMKYLFLLSLSLIVHGVRSQEPPHHFRIEEGRVIWRARLDSASVPADYLAKLKTKNIFQEVQERDGQVSGILRATRPLYKEAGYPWAYAPIFLLRHLVKGYATVTLNNGFYDITVSRIVYVRPSAGAGKEITLEKISVKKKGSFKVSFRDYDGRILHVTFATLFDVPYIR
jgi:hypothetical protein